MKNAIVGYTGLVGSNLLQFYKFDNFYNSKNFHEAKNKSFDTLFFCGIPAVKWFANKNPQKDSDVIEQIKSILDTINVKKIILISTIDVYNITDDCSDEDCQINPEFNHTYGKNRFLFEEYIKTKFEDYHIVRLPALFGKGLKKNIIYDLINNNNVSDIPANSSFQWYYLDWLKNDIDTILNNNIKICNLFTEPIHTRKIIEAYSDVYDNNYDLSYENPFRQYNLCTKHHKIFGESINYIRNEKQVMESIYEFLEFQKLDKSKLCVSNICVNDISQLQFASILKLFGIRNVQIAPTKIINSWDDLKSIDFDVYKNFDLNVYSFQSITYTLNDLNIFNSETRKGLYNHLINVIDCAEKNGVKILVFGCPRNRKILNFDDDNESVFVNFFKDVGKYLNDKNVKICIENNSKQYNCNFINKIGECSDIVRKIDNENIKMMVDIGNAIMEKDNIDNLKGDMDIICNVDISNPNMEDFIKPHESNEKFKSVIDNLNYENILNLEILIKNQNELEVLQKSLSNFVKIYSIEK